MNERLRKNINELIDKTQWTEFLKRFMNVLRMNIFVVDYTGKVMIWPYADGDAGRYGGQLLTKTFKFDMTGKENMLRDFYQQGDYLEYKDPFDFYCFAIPVKAENGEPFANLIVGPVILNKRWSGDDYINIGNQMGVGIDDLMDSIQELRVVSFMNIKTVLDLLSEVIRDIVELNLEKYRLNRSVKTKEAMAEEMAKTAQDMYATIHLDELLVTVLDVAINLTGAEGGSIMVFDKDREYLTVKVSRGIDEEEARKSRIRVGEGVAGTAAAENRRFYIQGAQGDNRIQQYLKRPDLRQSLVIPLSSKDKTFGVLNLHTKSAEHQLDSDDNNVNHLSRLITTAINSL